MTCRGHVRAVMCALSGNAARKSSLGGTEPQREPPPTERSPTYRRGRPPDGPRTVTEQVAQRPAVNRLSLPGELSPQVTERAPLRHGKP